MIVDWLEQTWGAHDSNVQVLRANGLEDFKAQAANLAGNGHGAVRAPLWQSSGSWVLDLLVFAASDAEMAATLDGIRAVTARSDDPMDEHSFEWQVPGEDQRCAFARVTDRQIPTDWTTHDRLDGLPLSVVYEACDPMVYGAEVEYEFEEGETWPFTAAGWSYSERWRWVVPGAAQYPRLTWTNGDVSAVLRLGQGQVNGGQNLVVDSKPHQLVTTVGGPTFNRYGWFDGGNTNVPPPFFRIPAGAQSITYSSGTGGATSTFRYRPGMP